MAGENEDDIDSELLLDDPLDDADDEDPTEGTADEGGEGDDTQSAGDGDDDIEYAIGDATESGHGNDSGLVKHMREELKELRRKLHEKDTRRAEPQERVGDKPKFDDYWDDPDKFESDLLAWNERKRKADERGDAERKMQAEVEEQGKRVVQNYEQQKQKLARPDYDDAEANVFAKLQPEKVALLLQGSDNAAQTIHALHRFPERLDELVKMDPARFAFAVGKLEGQLKVMPKRKAPQPEEIAKGNGSMSGGDKELARLEARADKTGDRSELAAYRAKQREKAK